jgi:hypothetical protein
MGEARDTLPGREAKSVKRICVPVAAGLIAASCTLTLSTSAAAVTIGANVNDASNTGAVGCSPACTFEDTADVPAQTMQAPCSGTVTTWRVDVATSATFSLRIIRDNLDGTETSTASSAAQTPGAAGVAAFITSIPIAAGEFIGVDIPPGGAVLGRNATAGSGNVFRPPLTDGMAEAPVVLGATVTALVNADVECSSSSAGPTGQRATALAKCKKKHSAKARKKCRSKAKHLPV